MSWWEGITWKSVACLLIYATFWTMVAGYVRSHWVWLICYPGAYWLGKITAELDIEDGW